MENERNQIIKTIENFFKDVSKNYDYIEGKLKNVQTNEFKIFLDKHIEQHEIKNLQLEKIGNFLNKEPFNKPAHELGVYFVVSLNEVKENDIRDNFGYSDEKGRFIPIIEKGRFKHFNKDGRITKEV